MSHGGSIVDELYTGSQQAFPGHYRQSELWCGDVLFHVEGMYVIALETEASTSHVAELGNHWRGTA